MWLTLVIYLDRLDLTDRMEAVAVHMDQQVFTDQQARTCLRARMAQLAITLHKALTARLVRTPRKALADH